jgi:hypothetical protein
MNALTSSVRRRWPAIALVASLVLNGFLIGMLVTDSLKPRGGISGERIARFELRRLDDRLPRAAVEQVAADLEPVGVEAAERLTRLRALREEILRLAAEPEPDRAAIDQRLATLREEVSAMQESVQRATYDSLLALPPETRASLARPPGENQVAAEP